MNTRVAGGAALLLTFACLRADEAAPGQVRMELMAVSVPAKTALRLIPALRNRATAAKSVAEIERLLAGGTAALLARPVVWARSGQRVFSTTHEEIRYPVESEPVEVGGDFSTPSLIGGQSVRSPDPYLDIPMTHETRDTGVSLEAELMVLPDGKSITVRMVARHVALDRWDRVLGETPEARIGLYEQPHFHKFQITTAFEAVSGDWNVAGVFVLPKPADRIELFLLRATATQPGHE